MGSVCFDAAYHRSFTTLQTSAVGAAEEQL
jgi:hypothetical protein